MNVATMMASHPDDGIVAVEGEACFSFGRAQVVRRKWDEPIDVTGCQPFHYLEFATLPRSRYARACFPDKYARCGAELSAAVGEIFFYPAGYLVHSTSRCTQQYSIVCSFWPDAAAVWLDDPFEWTDARLKAGLDIANPGIRNLLFQLGDELVRPGFAGGAMAELMTAQIGILLARHLLGVSELTGSPGLSARNLRRIDERLELDGAPPSLTELAGMCGLSVRHLTRAFRASRQRSIGAYICDSRMQRARQLLQRGASIKTIAYTMGFSTPSAFSTAFRRATGERPRDFARRSA